jgi:hypothetical protein
MSSRAETEQVPLPLPDYVAQAGIWANAHYPQTQTGVDLAIGHAVTDAILARELSWDELRRTNLSTEQAQALDAKAAIVHGIYNVPCKLRTEAYEANSYSLDRLIRLTGGAIGNVQTASANYAQAVLGRPTPLPPLPQFDLESKSRERRMAEDNIIATLFAPSRWKRVFSPDAVALGGLWKAGAESLSSGAVMRVSVAYRNDFRALFAPDITRQKWRAIEAKLNHASNVLRGVITDAVVQQVPLIETATRFTLDDDVVQAFLDDTLSPIAVPTMPNLAD